MDTEVVIAKKAGNLLETGLMIIMASVGGLFLPPPQTASAAMVGTSEITLAEALACNNSDQADYDCTVYKAIVDADDPGTTLDDMLQPTNLLLTVRNKKGVPLTNRWIIFEAGGHGPGYGPGFGYVAPGEYVAKRAGYGDDLIRWYNELGYITVDVTWECVDKVIGDPCYNTPWAGWVPAYPEGTGWFRNSGGAGYVGVGSRTRAIVEWAMANNGGRKVGAHGQSGGSGRLMTLLTRYQAESMFDTIVLDGGPVFAYIPWQCGITDDGDPNNGIATPGPLGPKPFEFDIEEYVTNGESSLRSNYDNARDPHNGEGPMPYRNCLNSVWDPIPMMDDSNFYMASDRDFSTIDLAVVLGGADGTPASPNARLWLRGYTDGTVSVPAISAKSLTIRQGYCSDPSDPTAVYTANRNEHPCTDWNPANFPTAASVVYDPGLVLAAHDTAQTLGGAKVLFGTMLSTLELTENSVDVVNIVTAIWSSSKQSLVVRATSFMGGNVTLTAAGFGDLIYNAATGQHAGRFRNVTVNPGTVTVTSTGGGSATKTVVTR